MKDFILNLNQRLNNQLKAIEDSGQSETIKSRESAQCISKLLLELKTFTINYLFQDLAQEIQFFKEIKPNLVSQLLYHAQIFDLKTRFPIGPRTVIESFYQNEITKIENFHNNHIEFYQYYRSGCSHFDEIYFVRTGAHYVLQEDNYVSLIDPGFSTSHDHILAKVKAYDLLSAYLTRELNALSIPIQPTTIDHPGPFHWTDSKASLVELIYSLHSAKVINGGSCDISHLVAFFEQAFNFQLSDSYRTYVDIKNRAKPTKFIDALKTALYRRIEEDEA